MREDSDFFPALGKFSEFTQSVKKVLKYLTIQDNHYIFVSSLTTKQNDMKKIFTKATIKNLISGSDELLPKYMKVFNTYRDLCGDDVNAIYQAISGYAVVHEFGVNANISEFRSREAAQAYIRDVAGQENIGIPKSATCFHNRVASWEMVKL